MERHQAACVQQEERLPSKLSLGEYQRDAVEDHLRVGSGHQLLQLLG